jgi:hypothetical protein
VEAGGGETVLPAECRDGGVCNHDSSSPLVKGVKAGKEAMLAADSPVHVHLGSIADVGGFAVKPPPHFPAHTVRIRKGEGWAVGGCVENIVEKRNVVWGEEDVDISRPPGCNTRGVCGEGDTLNDKEAETGSLQGGHEVCGVTDKLECGVGVCEGVVLDPLIICLIEPQYASVVENQTRKPVVHHSLSQAWRALTGEGVRRH